jgi:hypothetical protein
MKKSIAFLILPAAIFLSVVLATMPSFACTDFQVKAGDGTIIIARSNDLGFSAVSVTLGDVDVAQDGEGEVQHPRRGRRPARSSRSLPRA